MFIKVKFALDLMKYRVIEKSKRINGMKENKLVLLIVRNRE